MVKRLKNYKSYPLPEELKKILKTYNYVFNPSLVSLDDYNYLAIRVYKDATASIAALIFVWNKDERIEQIDLSDFFNSKLGFVKVADPKLFIMNNKVYGTFNTGDALKETNQLVLLNFEGKAINEYHLCHYTERQRTEKNWAFYTEADELFALYSLSPLTVIKSIENRDGSILFEKYYIDENQNFENYSIGTSLIKLKKGYGFIAHKKYYNNRKRLYLGRVCSFSTKPTPQLKVGKNILIHSFRSLAGNKHKFNKNLISCTYFSGIHRLEDEIVLGYGINDVSWNLAVIEKKKLWP